MEFLTTRDGHLFIKFTKDTEINILRLFTDGVPLDFEFLYSRVNRITRNILLYVYIPSVNIKFLDTTIPTPYIRTFPYFIELFSCIR